MLKKKRHTISNELLFDEQISRTLHRLIRSIKNWFLEKLNILWRFLFHTKAHRHRFDFL